MLCMYFFTCMHPLFSTSTNARFVVVLFCFVFVCLLLFFCFLLFVFLLLLFFVVCCFICDVRVGSRGFLIQPNIPLISNFHNNFLLLIIIF